jgi:hypothetical protein
MGEWNVVRTLRRADITGPRAGLSFAEVSFCAGIQVASCFEK